MHELTIEGKTYISSKRAAEITGYAKDYIGQLCREGRISARLVGRNWYVLESSIREHRFGKGDELEAAEGPSTPAPAFSWGEPRYKAEVPSYISLISDKEDKDVVQVQAPATPVERNTKPLGDMQSAWQEWFSKKEAEAIPTEEDAAGIEVEIPEDSAEEPPEEIEELDTEEEAAYEEEEIVPVHREMTVYEDESVLDLTKPQPHATVEEAEGHVETEDPVIVEYTPEQPGSKRHRSQKNGTHSYVLIRSVLVAVCLVTIAVTAIGTGAIQGLDTYGIPGLSEINFLAGVSEYNK